MNQIKTALAATVLLAIGYLAALHTPEASGQLPGEEVGGEVRVRYIPHPRDIRSFYAEVKTQGGPGTVDVWTVPPDKLFILTDVFTPGWGSTSHKHIIEILDQDDKVRSYLLDFVAGGNFHIRDTKLALVSGIRFEPGSTIRLRLTHANTGVQLAPVTLSGYIADL